MYNIHNWLCCRWNIGVVIGFSFSNILTIVINYLQSLKIEPKKLLKLGKAGRRSHIQSLTKINRSDEQQESENQLQKQITQLQFKMEEFKGAVHFFTREATCDSRTIY